jgi:hypothetical protein
LVEIAKVSGHYQVILSLLKGPFSDLKKTTKIEPGFFVPSAMFAGMESEERRI